MSNELQYPCVYLGAKDRKELTMPGFGTIVFEQTDDPQFAGKPVAYVTEEQGRFIEKRYPDIFRFHPPTIGERFTHMQAQIDELKARLDEALGTTDASPTVKRGRKPKAEQEAVTV